MKIYNNKDYSKQFRSHLEYKFNKLTEVISKVTMIMKTRILPHKSTNNRILNKKPQPTVIHKQLHLLIWVISLIPYFFGISKTMATQVVLMMFMPNVLPMLFEISTLTELGTKQRVVEHMAIQREKRRLVQSDL